MRGMRYQPQGAPRLNRRHKLAAGAQAILLASENLNLATAKPLATSGVGFLKQGFPAGRAWSFRKNFYIQTETLPAIGTASFVEFWYGYPAADAFASGSNTSPGFLTGSNANQIGIAGTVGDRSDSDYSFWGAVYNWPTVTSAGEALTPGQLTLLVVVRRQTGMEFWRNGRMVRFVAQAPVSYPAETMICGAFVEAQFWTSSSDTIVAGRVLTPTEPTANEIKQFSANPWQLFLAPHEEEEVPAAANTAIAPSAGPLTITGFAPSVARGVTTDTAPGAAGLTIAGYAPSITQGLTKTIPPAPASLTLTGYAPAVSQTAARNTDLAPAALTITGHAPTVTRGASQTIPAGAAVPSTLQLRGYAPTITQANNVTPHMYDATIMRLSAVRGVADLGPDRIQQTADLL